MIHYLAQSWNGINDVELATLEWVDWFNKTRLHSTIGYVLPFEFEKRYGFNTSSLMYDVIRVQALYALLLC